jgi:hypothetical protein
MNDGEAQALLEMVVVAIAVEQCMPGAKKNLANTPLLC